MREIVRREKAGMGTLLGPLARRKNLRPHSGLERKNRPATQHVCRCKRASDNAVLERQRSFLLTAALRPKIFVFSLKSLPPPVPIPALSPAKFNDTKLYSIHGSNIHYPLRSFGSTLCVCLGELKRWEGEGAAEWEVIWSKVMKILG